MDRNFIVVGDSLLDRYYEGSVTRISPEAPCPIVDVQSSILAPGGAANVAVNLAALGNKVDLVTVLSGRADDIATETLKCIFEQIPSITLHAYHHKDFYVPIKNRVCNTNGVQLIRFDQEINIPLVDLAADKAVVSKTLELLNETKYTNNPSIVVLCDYAKGVLINDKVVSDILLTASNLDVPSIVDPKAKDIGRYSFAKLIKPNLAETREMLSTDAFTCKADARTCAKALVSELSDVAGILMTAGADGMYLVNNCTGYSQTVTHIPAYPSRFFCNSVGAGDVVTAILADQLCCTRDQCRNIENTFAIAAKYASIGAGFATSKPGTAVLQRYEFESALAEYGLIDPDKRADIDAAQAVIKDARQRGETVVMVNGCFDMLHPGHIRLLQEAKKLGDILVVAVNSDEYIRDTKGQNRPYIKLEHRCHALEALSCIDLIMPFHESTPEKLIQAINPDILVKGAEYKTWDMSKIAGAEFLIKQNKRVVFIDMLDGYSTTQFEWRIK